MDNWIRISEALPNFREPVLLLVRAQCQCDHYVCSVLVREGTKEDWDWVFMVNDVVMSVDKHLVVAWQPLPAFPIGYPEGFKRERKVGH